MQDNIAGLQSHTGLVNGIAGGVVQGLLVIMFTAWLWMSSHFMFSCCQTDFNFWAPTHQHLNKCT